MKKTEAKVVWDLPFSQKQLGWAIALIVAGFATHHFYEVYPTVTANDTESFKECVDWAKARSKSTNPCWDSL